MVSSIGSYTSFMNTGLSQTELDTLAEQISQETGTQIDTTDAVTTYDTDGDGTLSGSELDSFLTATGMKNTMNMPPATIEEDDLFSQTDSDNSGGVSQVELESLAGSIATGTGVEIDTEDAVSAYDSDGDGELSEDELQSFLDANELQPPDSFMQQAMSVYSLNSASGQLSIINTGETEEGYIPVSLTA